MPEVPMLELVADETRSGETTSADALAGFEDYASRLLGSVDWDAQDKRVAEERERERLSAERDRMFARIGAMQASGFPERALEVARVADESAAFVAGLQERLTANVQVAVLAGAVGAGKTVAATWWALRRSELSPAFVRATTFAASSRYQGERQAWLNAGLLVLDDLGAEYGDAKGSLLTDLDELVDVFYGSRRRRLIITTNLTPGTFKSKYGERITSRLKDAGAWVGLTATSLRRGAE